MTLQTREPKQKSCWFPFKKQVENRRKITYDYDYDYSGVDFGPGNVAAAKSPKRNTATSVVNRHPSFRTTSRTEKGAATGSQSVSTGTDSSFETYTSTSNDSSPARSNFPRRRNGSRLSCQTDLSMMEQSFLNSSNDSVFRNESYDEEDSILEMGPDGLPSEYPHERPDPEDALFPMQLAMVETNCMTKHFWTDEIVEGGTFACLQQKTTSGGRSLPASVACVSNTTQDDEEKAVEVQVTPGGRNVTFKTPLGKNDFKIVQEVHDRSPNQLDKRIQQSLRAVHNGENLPVGVRYVSQEPEDIQEGAPLKRVFCTNVRLRKQIKSKNNENQKQASSSQMSSISSSYPSSSQNQTGTSGSSSLESSFLSGGLSSTRGLSNNGDDAEVLPPLDASAPLQPPASPWRQNDCRQNSHNDCRHHPHNSHIPSMDCVSQPCSHKQHSLPKRATEEDEANVPNFYVDVEAMREQLNGIRDLEELQAEDEQLEKDIGLARTSSLVDGDSTFMESVFEDAVSEADENPVVKEKNRNILNGKTKTGWFSKNRKVPVSKNHARLSEDTTRNAQVMLSVPKSEPPTPRVEQHQHSVETNPERHNRVSEQQMVSRTTVQSSRNHPTGVSTAHVTPDRSRSARNPTSTVTGQNPSSGNLDEQSVSRLVTERLKTIDKGQRIQRSSHVASTAAKFYQRREMLGLNSQESCETSSSSAPSSSHPSSKPESSSSSSSPTSFGSVEANTRKLSSLQRPSPENNRAIPKLSPPRGSPNERHAAKEAYFGRQKPKEEEHTFPSSSWKAFHTYGEDIDRSSQHRPRAKNRDQVIPGASTFDDDFWKDDDDDACEIKSAAFEEYDGDDSLFGDLKSNAESKVSKESEPSRMSFGNFNETRSTKSRNKQQEYYDPEDDYESEYSRTNQSRYTTDQSEYTGAEESRYTTERSRYTAGDESRYTPADMSRYTAGDQSRYTTDYSRYSRGGETSYLSKGSVSRFVDENDGEIVAAIDKWLY